jgi:hypothetical protein
MLYKIFQDMEYRTKPAAIDVIFNDAVEKVKQAKDDPNVTTDQKAALLAYNITMLGLVAFSREFSNAVPADVLKLPNSKLANLYLQGVVALAVKSCNDVARLKNLKIENNDDLINHLFVLTGQWVIEHLQGKNCNECIQVELEKVCSNFKELQDK